MVVPLAGRPVLFALARALAEAWPEDVSREALLARAFRARDADEFASRAAARRDRAAAQDAGAAGRVNATKRGFLLTPHRARTVAVLAPPVEGDHAEVLALLADGEAWSSSALALALGVSPRTVQRALEALADGRQGRILRSRPGPPLDGAEGAGFPDKLVAPGPAGARLG